MSLKIEMGLELRVLNVLDYIELKTKDYAMTQGRLYEEYVVDHKFSFSYKTFQRIVAELVERGYAEKTFNSTGNVAFIQFKREALHKELVEK